MTLEAGVDYRPIRAPLYLGIDVGKLGAIAGLDVDGRYLFLATMPVVQAARGGRDEYDVSAVRDLLEDLRRGGADLFVAVERLGAMPALFHRKRKPGAEEAETTAGGSIVNFNRGMTRGFEWLLTALRIPFLPVAPQTWQKAMHAGTSGSDTKQRSILAAHALFPGVSLRRTERSTRLDDGLAEALLLAEFGRRTRTGARPAPEAAVSS